MYKKEKKIVSRSDLFLMRKFVQLNSFVLWKRDIWCLVAKGQGQSYFNFSYFGTGKFELWKCGCKWKSFIFVIT